MEKKRVYDPEERCLSRLKREVVRLQDCIKRLDEAKEKLDRGEDVNLTGLSGKHSGK